VFHLHRRGGSKCDLGFQREQAEKHLVPGTDYSLPRKHNVEQSIDWTGLFRASSHEPIPSNNKGYMLLQKMGWSGTGLGRSLDGTALRLFMGASCAAPDLTVLGANIRLEESA
jgi:hypothetical protein